MRFDVMTLFPALIENCLSESIIGRALAGGIIELHTHNIRDYSLDKHRRVDDILYGGGKGMLMAPQPIYDCYKHIEDELGEKPYVVYMSPQGRVLDQGAAKRLSKKKNITFLCGHYEGIDRRIIEEIVDEEISIGDYVLTGGELPACIVIDAVSRMLPGVLSEDVCFEHESFYNGILEEPQYTRPPVFHGRSVPEVLLGGDHKEIEKWRYEAALELTHKNRPDLLK